MGAGPTQIPSIDMDGWANRIVRRYPEPWTGDAAKQPGGRLFTIGRMFGEEVAFLNSGVIYAWMGTRLATAEGVMLDRFAQDFFGDKFPRITGETDDSYRARIQAQLRRKKVTRAAIMTWITQVTGRPPRLCEPWQPAQTCAWDKNSYWDVDTEDFPFRWGDPGMRGAFAADIYMPTPAIQGDNPIFGWDAGFYWDTFAGTFWSPQVEWFISASDIDAILRDIKAAGVVCWRRYEKPPLNILSGGVITVPGNKQVFTVQMRPYQLPNGLILQPSWLTSVGIAQTAAGFFTAIFGVASPLGASLNWHVDAVQSGVSGTLFIAPGASGINIPIPAGYEDGTLMVQPTWTSSRFIDAVHADSIDVAFGVEAPVGGLVYYQFFPASDSGNMDVTEGDTEFVFSTEKTAPYTAFVIPTWNTDLAVTKQGSTVKAICNTPPPAGAKIYWVTHKEQ